MSVNKIFVVKLLRALLRTLFFMKGEGKCLAFKTFLTFPFMKREGKCLGFMKFLTFPFMKREGKCLEFMKFLTFPFMKRDGKCPAFMGFLTFPFMKCEGKCLGFWKSLGNSVCRPWWNPPVLDSAREGGGLIAAIFWRSRSSQSSEVA